MITSSMVQDEINSSYQSMVKRKILAIDLSDHSTYVQLGIGSATGWYKLLNYYIEFELNTCLKQYLPKCNFLYVFEEIQRFFLKKNLKNKVKQGETPFHAFITHYRFRRLFSYFYF